MKHIHFFSKNEKIGIVIDSITPCKTKKVKANNEKWFDGEVLKNINTRNNFFKRFKKSIFHIHKELYKKAKYNTLKLITAKIEDFLMINSPNILKNQKNYGKFKISWHAKQNTSFKFQCS